MFYPTDERHNEDHTPFQLAEVPTEDVKCVNCKHWIQPQNGINIFGHDLNLCEILEADVVGMHYGITHAEAHCGEFSPCAEYLEEQQERRASAA